MIGNYNDLIDQYDEETILLTPNRRLAAVLQQIYQAHQVEKNLSVWKTPEIMPINLWLNQLWKALNTHPTETLPILLNSLQENYLWEKVVKIATENTPLLQLSETAHAAKAAWGLMQQWDISLDHPSFETTSDYFTFKKIALLFTEFCESNHWVDNISFINLLIKNNRLISSPKKIILVGFTEVSPKIKNLLEAFETQGSSIQYFTLNNNHATSYQFAAADKDVELLTLARYAKDIHEQYPLAKQGYVIPELDKIRDRVQQVFTAVFENEDHFNISAGKSLTHYPIIYSALLLLKLNPSATPLDTFAHLLHTPFIGEAEYEKTARTHLHLQLRKNNFSVINLSTLILNMPHCPLLAKRLTTFLNLQKSQPEYQSHAAWMQQFMQLLTLLGWPGERSINSPEYQVAEQLITLFENLNALDHIDERVTYFSALHSLEKAASKILFQPKTPDAPIQILGLLEALALPFDYLWIANRDDLSWPEQPKPNPFIPKILQRELNMPRSNASRELEYCKAITEQFKLAATQMIFSYAVKKGDLALKASPLIRDLPPISLSLTNYESIEEKMLRSKHIEWYVDAKAPAITSTEKIQGGTHIIKSQALCPFRAFAEWRLHAHDMDEPSLGLRGKDRGQLLHKSLELFWNTHHNQENLLHLSSESLMNALYQCIQEAIKESNIKNNYPKKYIQLEIKRLQQLLLEWLEIEKKREPFSVIKHEKKVQVKLDQLTFDARIDRIDLLENGKKLIIDYKTGKYNSIQSWFSDRPEEPQLPLYALTDTTQTIGITFAELTPGNIGFKGLSQYDLNIEGIKLFSEWSTQLTQWQTILTQISADFYRGAAQVDPKETPSTCLWCTLKPLCRIQEECEIT